MNKEQILKAADATLEIARELNMDNCEGDMHRVEYDHLLVMRGKMGDMDDEGKLNRWLGWLQAAVYGHAYDNPEETFAPVQHDLIKTGEVRKPRFTEI